MLSRVRTPPTVRGIGLYIVRYRSVGSGSKPKVPRAAKADWSKDGSWKRPQKSKVQDTQKIHIDSETQEQIAEILQGAKEARQSASLFKDLENQALDLNQPNKKIVDYITKSQTYRNEQRLDTISKKWMQKFRQLSEGHKSKHMSSYSAFKNEIKRIFENGKISALKVGEPISVGDLVVLREGTTSFYIVLSCPKSLDATYYTLANREGKIVFAIKPQIKFRIPSFIPEEYRPVLESMVLMEEKTLDVAPIGVLDVNGKKSEASMPAALRKGARKHKVKEVDESAVQMLEDDEFMTDKLSSTMLTNSDTITYVIPPVARDVFSEPLTKVSIDSMAYFKNLSSKLEMLHRVLQFEDADDILGSPRMVSIFELLYLINELEFPKEFRGSADKKVIAALRTRTNVLLGKNAPDSLVPSSLGKTVYRDSRIESIERAQYDIASYVGLTVLLRRQSRLWKINEMGSTNPVTSVMVLPIQHRKTRDELCKMLSKKHSEVSHYISGRINKSFQHASVPESYTAVMQLFKDFVSGNIDGDSELQVWCATLLRDICKDVKVEGQYKYEYGKGRCYEILQLLGEVKYEDPSLWTYGIGAKSFESTLKNQYYQCLEKMGTEKVTEDFYEQDPVADIREEYHDPIFCIDAETAHEIDDGIGLREANGNYVVTVHIANPSSFIKPESVLSQIALGYGFTTYLPEGPLKMLPDIISDRSGLGTAEKTRTFAVEYELSKDFRNKELKQVQQQIKESSRVKFYHTFNYPKGYTYKKVDSILAGESDEHAPKLQTLYDISAVLKGIREKVGRAHTFNLPSSTVSVKYVEDRSEKTRFQSDEQGYKLYTKGVEITVGSVNSQSRSTQLVTEMMISANHLASNIANRNQVPVIYRNQIVNLNEAVKQEISKLESGDIDSLKTVVQIMNGAKVDIINKGHEALGLTSYGHITSPLRRYSDMVNQWAFQQHMCRSQEAAVDLSNIVNHLQAREIITKNLSMKSTRFWQGVFLKEYFSIADEVPEEERIKFDMHMDKKAANKAVKVTLNNFRLKSVLEFEDAEQLRQLIKQTPESHQYHLKQADFIEDEFSFKYETAA